MRKGFIIAFLVLGAAFLGVSYWKEQTTSGPMQSNASLGTDSTQSRVVEFWRHYNQATAYRTAGAYNKAEEQYRQALALDPVHEDALYYMGNMQLANQNFNEAANHWIRLTVVNPQSARGYMQLGNLYSCRDTNNGLYNMKKAEAHFTEAARLNREITVPLLQLAKIDLMDKRLMPARQKLDDVVKTNFRSWEARFLQGYLEWKKGMDITAESSLDQAVSILRGSDPKYSNVGEGRTASGEESMSDKSVSCALFTEVIHRLITKVITDSTITYKQIYKQFDSEVEAQILQR